MNDHGQHQMHPAEDTETVFTCPMHPEIRQNEPGDCPKCGMHLVPEGSAEADHGHHHHGHSHAEAGGDGRYDTVPAGYDGPVYTCPNAPRGAPDRSRVLPALRHGAGTGLGGDGG